MKAATFRHTSAAGGMLVPCQVRGFIAANQGGTAESKIFRPWSMFIDQGFFCASMSHTAQIPKRYKAESAPANCCRFAEDFMRQQPEQRGGSRSFNTRVNAVQHPLRKTRERALQPEQRGGSRSFNTRVNAVQHPLRKTRERALNKWEDKGRTP